jgi:hypothetical protein
MQIIMANPAPGHFSRVFKSQGKYPTILVHINEVLFLFVGIAGSCSY